MTSYQIGAQLYSVRDMTQTYDGLLSTLKALKFAGYNSAQLSGAGKDLTAEEIRRAYDLAEMTCPATHISFQQMEEDLDAVIQYHKTLNCPYPGIGGLPGEYRHSTEGYLEFTRRASAIAEKLENAGMHFIYHSHHFEFARLPDGRVGYDIMVENSSKAMQFELDCFWAQAGGQNVIETIKRLEGRMDVIHFKDMEVGSFQGFKMCPIGDGSMDYKAIMAAAESIGVKHAFVEQDNAVEYTTGSIECMVRSASWLKANGGRL